MFDQQWDIVELNSTAAALFGGLGLGPGDNAIDAICRLPPDGPVTNIAEIVDLMCQRVRVEVAQAGINQALAVRLSSLMARRRMLSGNQKAPPPETPTAVIPLRMQVGDSSLALFSMLAQFGSVQEVSMADLRVELYFAEDDATQAYFDALGASSSST